MEDLRSIFEDIDELDLEDLKKNMYTLVKCFMLYFTPLMRYALKPRQTVYMLCLMN